MSFISGSTEQTVSHKDSTESIQDMMKRSAADDGYRSPTAADEGQEGYAETAAYPSKIFLKLVVDKWFKVKYYIRVA